MTRNDPQYDPAESLANDARYGGFGTEEGYVVYDTENAAAWIESDVTLDPAELQ